MAESLKQQAVRGVMWSAIERFSVQGVMFTLSLIIARFVTPEEYGLVAMLAIFMSIASTFVNSGFSNALIQKRGGATQTDCSTVFYFNTAISVGVYILLYLCAPLIAQFYKEPMLVEVLRWDALILIISGLTIVQGARLTIALDFKTQAKASLLSVAVGGGVGVWMAYHGYGVWALVSKSLITAALGSILLWIFAKWRPSWEFSRESFKTLFGFGSKLLASGLLHTIYINLYSLVIGRFYSAADVGYYRNANGIVTMPSINIMQVIARAIYPMQCKMQDDDEALSRSFVQYLRISCYVIFPLMVGLSVLATPLVEVVLTEKWLPAAELVSILAIAYMLYPVMVINNNILNVKGRSDYFLYAEIIKKVVAIAILVATLPFGVVAMAWGVVGYNILDMIIIIFYSRKVISTGYWRQFKALLPIFLLNAAMGACVWLSINYLFNNDFARLFGGAGVGVLSYVVMSYVFRFKEIANIKSILTNL